MARADRAAVEDMVFIPFAYVGQLLICLPTQWSIHLVKFLNLNLLHVVLLPPVALPLLSKIITRDERLPSIKERFRRLNGESDFRRL